MNNSLSFTVSLGALLLVSAGMTGCSKSLEQQVEELREAQGYDVDPIIFGAISAGRVDLVDFMIKSRRFALDSKNHEGSTPLHAAAKLGQIRIMSLLLSGGANPKLSDSMGNLVIHSVAAAGNVEAMKLLIGHGANLDEPMVAKALTPLDMEARRLFPAEEWDSNDWGSHPIHIAAANGNIDMVKFLISQGVNPDVRDKQGRSALDYAGTDGLEEKGSAGKANRLAVVRLYIPGQRETPARPPEPSVTPEDLQQKYFGK